MRSCLQIIIISGILPRSLFSYTFLGCLGWLSLIKVLLLAMVMLFPCEIVAASPPSKAMPDLLVSSGRSKTVRIASKLSPFHQDIPIVGAIAYAGWKQSSLK